MSLETPKFSTDLTEFTQQIEDYLDKVVQHGTDQELFIASYLQGHFAVMAGQSQVQGMTKVNQLDELMRNSLQLAFENNELVADDQNQVWALWNGFIADKNSR